MGRLSGIHADRMIRALARLDWTVIRSKGSHHALAKPGHPGTIIIPLKKGRAVPTGTARAILKQAGITEEQFFAVYF